MDYCPQHAISFEESIRIDVDKCDDCGICANVCPTGALQGTNPTNAELVNRVEQHKQASGIPGIRLPESIPRI